MTSLRFPVAAGFLSKLPFFPRCTEVFSGSKCMGTSRATFVGFLILNEKPFPQLGRSAVH